MSKSNSKSRFEFYSDRLHGPTPRDRNELLDRTKVALLNKVQAWIDGNWLAQQFPYQCEDGHGVAGTNVRAAHSIIQGLIPDLNFPVRQQDDLPDDEPVFDLIEYMASAVAKPIHGDYHSYMRHWELSFDQKAGQAEVIDDVNLLLSRGGAMYTLTATLQVERLGLPEAQEVLASLRPDTGDLVLDGLIKVGLGLYRSKNQRDRQLGLQNLWDSFERVKTLEAGKDKKAQVEALLARFPAGLWGDMLDKEMKELTTIGNGFHIRHFEKDKIPLPNSAAIDYAFGRLATLLFYLLRQTNRLK